jgi:hypothetical protein
MGALAAILAALNALANALGAVLVPLAWVPAWVSLAAVSVLTGGAMLVMFKYTSNQRAIKRARRQIRANLLAVRLFKESVRVGVRAQRRVFGGAMKLLLYSVVPVLAMTVPMALFIAQLAAWYQTAPLPVGEETVVTVKLGGEPGAPLPAVSLAPDSAFEVLAGPVRATSAREVCWSIRARQPGYHVLKFVVDGQEVEKELAVGRGVMRVSPIRPARGSLLEQLEYPRETAFGRDSVVQRIEIEYPTRAGRVSGTDNWLISWFVVSCVAGFCLRGVLKVNI